MDSCFLCDGVWCAASDVVGAAAAMMREEEREREGSLVLNHRPSTSDVVRNR